MNKLNFLPAFVLAGASILCAQIEPNAGSWSTWVLSSGSQLRLSSPSSFGAGNDELVWLKTFMAQADSNALAQVAYWDAGAPSYRWMQIAFQELTARNVPAPLFTRAMALVAAAMYDG